MQPLSRLLGVPAERLQGIHGETKHSERRSHQPVSQRKARPMKARPPLYGSHVLSAPPRRAVPEYASVAGRLEDRSRSRHFQFYHQMAAARRVLTRFERTCAAPDAEVEVYGSTAGSAELLEKPAVDRADLTMTRC
jgi:hypothetical protein